MVAGDALETLPKEIARLEAEIAALQKILADPKLYARDPVAFARQSAELDGKLAERERAEEQWLELELKREALEQA